jgi:hypothetical protein
MKRILAMTLTMVLIIVNFGFSQTLTPPTDEGANTPASAPVAPAPKADGGAVDGDSLVRKYILESTSEDKVLLPESCKQSELDYINATAKAKADRDLAVMALDKKRDTSIDMANKAFVTKLQAAQVAETKRGNLEGALAIKARIEKMNPKSEVITDETKKNNFEKLAGKLIIGKWKRNDNVEFVFTLSAKGRQITTSANATGTWECKNNQIISDYSKSVGGTEIFIFTDEKTLTSKGTTGNGNWTLTKISN